MAVVIGEAGVAPVVLGGASVVVAVPIVAETLEEARDQWEAAAAAGADLVEWRLDAIEPSQFDPPRVAQVAEWGRETLKVPVLATIRTQAEGGNYRENNGRYLALVRQVASWADGVDVEVNREGAGDLIASLSPTVSVIASFHEFSRRPRPGQIEAILTQMVEGGATVAKVAWMVQDETDLEIVSGAALWAGKNLPVPAVVIGMGEAGRPTRLGEFARAAAFTFAVASKSSAPGQPSVEEVKASLKG